MAKVNTLFTYFTKKQTSKDTSQSSASESDVLSPLKNGNKSGTKTQDSVPKGKANAECPYKLYDIVWTKLDGYPWWPGIVSNHPKTGKFLKCERKRQFLHVQFFDDPPTRGWVKETFAKPFKGSDCPEFQRGGKYYTHDKKCHTAAKQADAAMATEVTERASLIVTMDSSPEEESGDEDMEVDGEAGLDSSKENAEEPKSPDSSQAPSPMKKTSGKLTRSSTGTQPQKRRRIVLAADSEESGDEFKPPASDPEQEISDSDVSSGVDEDAVSEDNVSDPESPLKKRKRSSPTVKTPKQTSKKAKDSLSLFSTPSANDSFNSSKSYTPSVSDKTKSKLALFSAPDEKTGPVNSEGRSFPHLSLDFLKPDNIKDRDGRKMSDPEYNPHTVYVSDSFLSKQTPAMRQWWEMKSRHYDTVLFFKMGKFYELFHMDAVIAVNELGLVYMRGEHAHSGFPEISYGRYAESLIQKGYKVARIEQTETPDMCAERCKQMAKSTKFDKVVTREICSIQTKGTKRYSFIDGDSADSSSAYLLAICERVDSEAGSGQTFGVCFVDTSIGNFYVGQFDDDRHCSRLRTLISHFPPAQILTERGKLSDKTNSLLTNNLTSVLRETLRSGTEFWDSSKTLKNLSEATYFVKEGKESGIKWPSVLKSMTSEDDALGLTAGRGHELGLSALGAIIWYLQYSLMDDELLSMGEFQQYIPVDTEAAKQSTQHSDTPQFITGRHKMVLDAVTLANLDFLVNNNTGTSEGTLLGRIDNCSTAFGKRLLTQWLCAPLCNPDSINDRLDAVDDLVSEPEITAEVTELMKKLPDLSRLLSKIHTLGSANRSKNHPEGRAIYFEDITYSKRKIEDFLSALSGFETAVKIVEKFEKAAADFKSKLLSQTVTSVKNTGKFPYLKEELDFFKKAFNHEKARSEGVIKPSTGVDEDYDNSVTEVKTKNDELQEYLERQKKRIGCRSIVFWGTAKNRFQMEIPDSVKHVPDDYEVASSKKGFKRYKTPDIEEMFGQLMEVEDRRDAALRDIMRRIFFTFDKSYQKWSDAIQCLSVLDVLMTLAHYSRCGDGVMCRPQFVLPSADRKPFLEIREGRHPCIGRTFSGSDFIPNDTIIGVEDEDSGCHVDSQVVLVTGPNMGGKSTLMRQVGVITVLAQLGCYVPAEKCSLTPVDRIFTRLGASDRIMAGESTFYVELSETSSILQHATQHSLVLLDELGRGTATYDGTAIAGAVVNELSQNIKCRTLFSTHYHSLVEEFSDDPNVRLGHMACMVENENEDDPTQETITFLYKFIKGACPKSYGFNAARLANIPDEVISVAHKKAKEFQLAMDKLKYFRFLCGVDDDQLEKLKEIQQLLSL